MKYYCCCVMYIDLELVAYFDCITLFEALQCRTSIKGGDHTCTVGT